jgi:hypothetical protein
LKRSLALAILVSAAALAGTRGVPPAAAAGGLELGLNEGAYLDHDPATRELWFDRTVSARADLAHMWAIWQAIAPTTRPPGFDATDPADPAYSWESLDAAVRDASERGLKILMGVSWAPQWAEGPNRPSVEKAPLGTWRPDPDDLADFGRALASRYSGTFVDPSQPSNGALPAVRRWQLWAEPNTPARLTPQWRHGRAFSPKHYREMLNAFYAAVKGVTADSFVLAGGTAPHGDPSVRRERIRPVRFFRTLLCFNGSRLRKAPCRNPARLDAVAHNPINLERPRRKALNRDDASIPDLAKIKRIVRKARRTGRIEPEGRKPFWATEFWWRSDPPKPYAPSKLKHARWLEEALYLFWRQGVDTAIWFQLRDAPPPWQTGLFERDGTAKPAYQAFRFPFVGDRTTGRRVRVWGKAPAPGPVQIQRKRGGEWHDLKSVEAPPSRVFADFVKLRGSAILRARTRTETSLPWRQR